MATRQDDSRLLRALVDTAVDGVILIDARGTVLLFNPACERLFGYRADEVVGQNVKMLMPPPFRDEHDGYLANYDRTGDKKIIGIGREVVGQRKDGSTFPLHLSVGEAKQNGESAFVGIIHDITEQKRTEHALREGAGRLRAVVDTAVDGVILIDDRGTVLLFNPACERLFGYAADEVLGRNVKMLMPAPFREEHDQYLENYNRTGRKKIIGIGREVVGQRKDGTTFPLHLSVGQAKQDGKSTFVGIMHDLSELHETQRRVRELHNELLHTSRLSAMGQLSSSLAHELNQPLTAVANYTEAARQMLATGAAPVAPRILELLEKAGAQAERAGQIIRRLRSFVEKGVVERSVEPLNRVVEEATALATTGARVDGIRVILDLAPDLPPLAMDKVQIQQVLVNLVRNAVEVLRQADQRTLTVRTVQRGPGEQEVAVIDTGAGIPPEIANRLFTPFATTKKDGMGIGLSISQSIVEAHGGRIWTEPNPEGGAMFRFTLPSSSTTPGGAA